ncbi:hypothetical protein HDU97_005993 [Phlyctochytrium planicorne]|nr:hypothetical protein HDU97_005993 [Phlyctochytrium planicorne]
MLVDRISHYGFVEGFELRTPLERRSLVDDGRRIISFRGFNRTFEFDVWPNSELIVQGASVEVDGQELSLEASRALLSSHAPYVGHVAGDPQHGWIRMVFGPGSNSDRQLSSTQDGHFVDGVFAVDDGVFQIKMVDTYRRSRRDFDTDIATPLSRHPSHYHSQMIIISEDMTFAAAPNPDTIVLPNFASSSASSIDTCSSEPSPLSPPPPPSARASKVCKRDLKVQAGSCGVNLERGGFNLLMAKQSLPRIVSPGSTSFLDSIFNKTSTLTRRATCGSSKRYMFMGAAADCNYVKSYGGSSGALTQILSNFNTASKVYESSFNVALAVVKVKIETACAANTDLARVSSGSSVPWNRECSSSYNINERLSDFSYWRGNYPGASSDNVGLWHLLSGCSSQTSGQAVGVAWLKTTCTTDAKQQSARLSTGETVTEYVSGTGVSSKVPAEWKVVAHEVGHNFGANHDCDTTTCGCQSNDACLCCKCESASDQCNCDGQFLMHPTDNAKTSAFSTCSQNSICATLSEPGRSSCLKDQAAVATVTENICGNGVREANEECDCGDDTSCANDPCCDGKTCKLKDGAVCDDLNDDCCSGCKLKAKDTVCRPAIGVCDYAEVCTGQNKTCPTDVFHPDKESCGNNLMCASGQCTSRSNQCQNRNSAINTTGTCPGRDSECLLYCATASGYCTLLAGAFVDGTPCGYSGTCRGGTCTEDNFFGAAIDWFKNNLQIGIPILVAVALIVLSIIISLIRCCCQGCRTRPKPRPELLPVVPSTAVYGHAPMAYSYSPTNPNPQFMDSRNGGTTYLSQPATAVVSPNGTTGQLGTYASSTGTASTRRGSRPGVPSTHGTSTHATSTMGSVGSRPTSPSARSNWVDPSKYNGF